MIPRKFPIMVFPIIGSNLIIEARPTEILLNGFDIVYESRHFFFSFAGNPLPSVTWNVRGDNPNNVRGIALDNNTVANVLRIDRVHRESHGKMLVCEASNIPNTFQLSKSVTMNVYCEWILHIMLIILLFIIMIIEILKIEKILTQVYRSSLFLFSRQTYFRSRCFVFRRILDFEISLWFKNIIKALSLCLHFYNVTWL